MKRKKCVQLRKTFAQKERGCERNEKRQNCQFLTLAADYNTGKSAAHLMIKKAPSLKRKLTIIMKELKAIKFCKV